MTERIAKRLFVASIVFLGAVAVFAYGLAVGRYGLWPFPFLQRTQQAAVSLWRFGELVPEGRRVPAPEEAPRQAFTIHEPARMHDGYYVFLGASEQSGRYAAWLYDQSGRRVHTWEIDYATLDPGGPSSRIGSPHALQVLPDGSLVVAFDDGDVMGRIDACSEPVWVKRGIFTHALSQADDGSLWTWRAEGSHYAQYHYLVNFDPDTGESIRTIGLVEDLIAGMGPSAALFGVRPDHPFRQLTEDPAQPGSVDFFHPNDIEVLSEREAPMFAHFEPGDLLMSFRALDLVLVTGPEGRRVKWSRRGPWIAQHDPDFRSDGRISVYSNNTRRGRSEILIVDPSTGEIENELFHGEVEFYSASMGKHQYLPNGNVLIVVPDEGRILEVTADGDYVMEFNNLSSDSREYNKHVENGIWLARDYFRAVPGCANRQSDASESVKNSHVAAKGSPDSQ